MRHRTVFLAGILAGAVLPQTGFSQAPPSSLPAGAGQPLYDPQQFPAQHGVVQQFTLTGRGDIDGFILKEGTEVKTPPALSTQVAFSIKPGDQVTIHGLHAAALPLLSAVSITNDATHRTISENAAPASPAPPPPGRLPPPPQRGSLSEVNGRVRMPLHGPQGEINGVLLESGAVLRLLPDQADRFAALLQPRQSLVAQEFSTTNSLGTVLEVQALGPTREQLQPVGPPPPG